MIIVLLAETKCSSCRGKNQCAIPHSVPGCSTHCSRCGSASARGIYTSASGISRASRARPGVQIGLQCSAARNSTSPRARSIIYARYRPDLVAIEPDYERNGSIYAPACATCIHNGVRLSPVETTGAALFPPRTHKSANGSSSREFRKKISRIERSANSGEK